MRKAVNPQVGVAMKVVLELDESMARALDALAGYGDDAFLRTFYQHMGSHYLQPHEAGLRRLFEEVREKIPGTLSRVDRARKILEKAEEESQ